MKFLPADYQVLCSYKPCLKYALESSSIVHNILHRMTSDLLLTVSSSFARCRDALAIFVARKAIALWLGAVFVWLSDRFARGAWRPLSLPGGHWLWHLLVSLP